jgi:alpha-amylase/alpha-mannosidase (GH57 family)
MRSVVIHAHFYQPPREHPYFDEIEAELSAAPYHDWNARIDRECYRAVVAARVSGAQGRIARVVNTLESLSFNVGPTLSTWLEQHSPDVYRAILAADRESCERLGGHGNAIAHPYHHVILPLASRRDKVTEVRWGIADFRRRYGREPEGFWLPETAVDDETLDVLAQEGIRFTILAPYQVRERPPNGLPGRYTTANGRTIALCTYHGDLSHGIAFGGLVRDAAVWAREILRVPAEDAGVVDGSARSESPLQLVSMATDGETYGHHHKYAEMAVARVVELAAQHGMKVENYAAFLARHPASFDVELVAPSAWSCAHGVERWRSDCGCRGDGSRNPSQAWRTPLRDGLDALATELHAIFERDGAALLGDVWAARDAYGHAVSEDADARYRFSASRVPSSASVADRQRIAELLEMERDSLRMFTSCAWFFDDIGGLEPQQVLRYAVRAIALSGEGERLGRMLRETLRLALSNDAATGTGADVFDRLAAGPDAAARTAAAAAALEALGVPPNGHLSANAVTADITGDRVTVVARDTATARHFRVAVVERNAHDITCDVTALDDEESRIWRIPLAAFPERPRLALRRAFRRALLPRALTAHELEQLSFGEVTLRELLGGALQRVVGRLGGDESPDALEDADALLDLFEQLETNVPFDVQTTFWQRWTAAGAAQRARLEPLRRRLGFEG